MIAEYEENREFNMCVSHDATYHAHFHTHLEIMYVIKGEVTVFINSVEYIAHENEVIFILPHQIHSFVSGWENEICLLHVSHTYLATYLETYRENELENPIISVSDKTKKDVLCSIQSFIFANYPMSSPPIGIKISAEYNASQNASVKALLLGYVALLLDGEKWVKKKSSNIDIARKIIEYCYEHYMENISLYDTANALNVSEHTVTRMFSKVFKCGFRNYINALKISAVENMLLTTNTPITEIAFACGFETLRTFNRVFMAKYNMTPSEFRNNYNKENR